jgi:hypothetical protein
MPASFCSMTIVTPPSSALAPLDDDAEAPDFLSAPSLAMLTLTHGAPNSRMIRSAMHSPAFSKQQEVLLAEQLLDTADDLAVVDGVAYPAAFRRVLAGQPDFQVELYGLRHFALPTRKCRSAFRS